MTKLQRPLPGNLCKLHFYFKKTTGKLRVFTRYDRNILVGRATLSLTEGTEQPSSRPGMYEPLTGYTLIPIRFVSIALNMEAVDAAWQIHIHK